MRFLVFGCGFLTVCFLISCGNNVQNNTEKLLQDSSAVNSSIIKGEIKIIEPIEDKEVVVLQKNGITLTEIKSETNKDAVIVLNTKKYNEGENHLSFSVTNIQSYSISYLANNYSLSQFI